MKTYWILDHPLDLSARENLSQKRRNNCTRKPTCWHQQTNVARDRSFTHKNPFVIAIIAYIKMLIVLTRAHPPTTPSIRDSSGVYKTLRPSPFPGQKAGWSSPSFSSGSSTLSKAWCLRSRLPFFPSLRLPSHYTPSLQPQASSALSSAESRTWA